MKSQCYITSLLGVLNLKLYTTFCLLLGLLSGFISDLQAQHGPLIVIEDIDPRVSNDPSFPWNIPTGNQLRKDQSVKSISLFSTEKSNSPQYQTVEVNCYPNPVSTTSQMTIKKVSTLELFSVEVRDSQGTLHYETSLQGVISFNPELEPGVYNFTFDTSGGPVNEVVVITN